MSEVEKGNDVATHLDKNQRNINEAVDLFSQGKRSCHTKKSMGLIDNI